MSTLVETTDLSSAQLTALTSLAAAQGKTIAELGLEFLLRQLTLASEGVLLTQGDLEIRIGGPKYLVRLTDDDGDGIADPANLAYIFAEASKHAKTRLWPGFPVESQIEELVAKDIRILGAVCDLAAGIAGARRPEWVTSDGKPYFGWRYEQGDAYLEKIGAAKLRSVNEKDVGSNAVVPARVSIAVPPEWKTAPSRASPTGRGGF